MKYVLIVAMVGAPLLAQEGVTPEKFGQEFLKHWTTARDLTTAVAKAMPPDGYDFKPTPEEMTFGEQILHIAGGNYSYWSRISGTQSPFKKPDKVDKDTAIKILGESFGYCAQAVEAAKNLDVMRGPEGRQMSLREIMLGAVTHMAHHRGQAEVYLRLKGLKPPTYQF